MNDCCFGGSTRRSDCPLSVSSHIKPTLLLAVAGLIPTTARSRPLVRLLDRVQLTDIYRSEGVMDTAQELSWCERMWKNFVERLIVGERHSLAPADMDGDREAITACASRGGTSRQDIAACHAVRWRLTYPSKTLVASPRLTSSSRVRQSASHHKVCGL